LAPKELPFFAYTKNKTSLKLESLAMAMAVVMVGAGPPKKFLPE